MKKLLFIAAIIFSLLKAEAVEIKGKIAGLKDKTVIGITHWMGNTGFTQYDTIKNESFKLQLDTEENGLLKLSVSIKGADGIGKNIWAYRNSVVQVSGSGDNTQFWIIESNVKEQAMQNKLDDAAELFYRKMDSLKSLTAKNKDNEQEYDRMEDSLYREIAKVQYELVKYDPNSAPTIAEIEDWVTFKYLSKEQYEILYNNLNEQNRNSLIGEALHYAINPPKQLAEGDKYIDFELQDIDGNKYRLSDFLGKGKIVMFDFWSIGCGPCHAAVPKMKETLKNFPDKLSIIGINLDMSKQMWGGGNNMMKPEWPSLSDGKGMRAGIAKLYNIWAMPAYFLIASDGTILKKTEGYFKDDIEKLIENYKL